MNASTSDLPLFPALTFRDSLAAYFRERPGVWVDGMVIANVSGCYAWRTRVSELRTQLGMRIDNRQRWVGRRVVSEYRFVPEEICAEGADSV